MMAGGMSTSSTVAGTTAPTETEKFTLGTDRMFTFVNDWRICVRCSFEMFTEPVEVDRSPEAPALSAPFVSADPLVPAFWSDAAPLVSVVPAFWPDAAPLVSVDPLVAFWPDGAFVSADPLVLVPLAVPLVPLIVPLVPLVVPLVPLAVPLVPLAPPLAGGGEPLEPLAKLPATVNAKAVAATVLNNPIRMLTSRKSVARIRHWKQF
jgi:hypothetical protein